VAYCRGLTRRKKKGSKNGIGQGKNCTERIKGRLRRKRGRKKARGGKDVNRGRIGKDEQKGWQRRQIKEEELTDWTRREEDETTWDYENRAATDTRK